MWLDHGRIRDIGETDSVVAKYLGEMVAKDSAYLSAGATAAVVEGNGQLIAPPESANRIPNIDHRYGDGARSHWGCDLR